MAKRNTSGSNYFLEYRSLRERQDDRQQAYQQGIGQRIKETAITEDIATPIPEVASYDKHIRENSAHSRQRPESGGHFPGHYIF